MRLSGIIIAKNSEKIIVDALKSLNFCDEVIVVDNGSTDNTVSVSKQLGAKVIKNPKEDFSSQRNAGLEYAQGDWVLYIDTDERVSEELKSSIQKAIGNSEYSVYKIKRKNYYLGNNPWPKIEYIERLFKSPALKGWKGQLHESPIYSGNAGTLDGFLIHFTHRDLTGMLNKTIIWSQIESKLRLDARHPKIVWWRLFRVMWTGFFNSFFVQGGWKVGTAGLIESIFQGFSLFITYARVWEKQEEKE